MIFECKHMLFWLCNAQATFQRLIQSCLEELNLIYCLIYLDDMIVFLKTEDEHLQCLHVVFDHFREHNLRLKPTKCEFFQNEINYLAHHISGRVCGPSKENLKAVVNFVHRNLSLSGLGGALPLNSSKGLYLLCNHCTNIYLEKVPNRKNEQVTLTKEALDAFEMLKKACLEAPVLAFVDFNKSFLLENDASKLGFGLCYHKNRLTINTI